MTSGGDSPIAPPSIADTNDLRSGPPINDALLAVLPLVGSWAGRGVGVRPADGSEFRYAQRATLAHDGRPFLSYSSHTWLIGADGAVLRPAFRESGFLRPGPGEDDLELVLASAAGLVEVFAGVAGDQRWEFATTGVGFTPTAKQVAGERRLFALLDAQGSGGAGNRLGYVAELALTKGDYRPHLQAELARQF
jgi:hypothetical protein